MAFLNLLDDVGYIVTFQNSTVFLLFATAVFCIVDKLVHAMQVHIEKFVVILDAGDLVLLDGCILIIVCRVVDEVVDAVKNVALIELDDARLAVIIDLDEGVLP